ncbi:MAG: hypothetical protein ER33_08470 [Cyanobium sp. CACIAM 14]|nr:MAG: hypothetical protein ER33_08470 [Cyanobium sp. CACIAM 14]
MAFVNEVVSDEDIARYNLPFKPGAGRYWTRDKENDCYLWGGIVESYARDYVSEGQFWLYLHGKLLDVSLNLGHGSISLREKPFYIVWKEVSHVQPYDLGGLDRSEFFSVLKQALLVFGYDGEENRFAPDRVVTFEF